MRHETTDFWWPCWGICFGYGAAGLCPQDDSGADPSPGSYSTSSSASVVAPKTAPNSEDEAWAKVVAAAKREERLTIYSYWGADTNLKLQQWFKEKYGINVEIIVGRGAELVARILTEKRMGQMVVDVFVTGAGITQARDYDLTISLADLPVLREKGIWVLPPDTNSQDKLLLYFGYQAYPSAINTKQINPPDVPRSYKDLIAPAWKGRMIAVSPITQSNLYNMFVPLINQGIVDMDFMKALGKQDISFQVSNDAAFQVLARGERPFFINAVNSVMTQYVAQGATIKPVVLDEGTTTTLSPGLAVIKGAPHPNAAKLFANWMLTQEGQDVYCKVQSFNSIRKDVTDYTPPGAQFTAKKLINTTLEDQDQAIKMFNAKAFPKLWEN